MYFEHLHFDSKTQVIHDARIGDEVFNDAKVEWRKLSRADMRWIFDHLQNLTKHWRGVETRDVEAHLRGMLNTKGQVIYTLHVVGDETAVPWSELDEDAQQQIMDACQTVLETIHAFLLIF